MKFNEIKVGDILYYIHFQTPIERWRFFYITNKNKVTAHYIEFSWTPTIKQRLTIMKKNTYKLEWDGDAFIFEKFIKNDQNKHDIFKIIFEAKRIVDERG